MSTKDATLKPRVGWYLAAPFNTPRTAGYFRTQNWWLEEPWYSEDGEGVEAIPREAALYELARRHPDVGVMLFGHGMPRTAAERFLFLHGRVAWPWLAAELREEFRAMAKPKNGSRSRDAEWLKIISAFEGSEVGRVFDCSKVEQFFGFTKKLPDQKSKTHPRRRTLQPLKANQNQRRAFQRICERVFLSLKSA